MFHCRHYKNGYIELPNGQILTEELFIERILAKSQKIVSKEKVKEVIKIARSAAAAKGRFLRLGDEKKGEILIEFVDEDLDSSKNPALNN
jgi:hypothetical protein